MKPRQWNGVQLKQWRVVERKWSNETFFASLLSQFLHDGWAVPIAFLVFVMSAGPAAAEVPTVDYLFPAGGKTGSKVQVSAGGKLDPWPAKVWTDCPGLTFSAEETKGKFTVEIATNAPVGPHFIRIYNQDGASNLRCFLVGRSDEVAEKEPNDDPQKAHRIEKFPLVINGRLEKSGDTDSFAFELQAGQWLIAAVDAYSIDSPMDPTLHLLDPHGTKVAFNHDAHRLDPLLAHRAEEPGIYVLQLTAFSYPPKADIKLTGSDASVYRLAVTTGPYARYSFPAGAQRGSKATLRLFGWNLGATGQAIVHRFDATNVARNVDHALISVAGVDNCVPIAISSVPEEIEVEPNGSVDLAQPVTVPCTLNGQIQPAGDEDRFLLSAKKGDRLLLRVKSSALDFPLDAVLSLEDQKGTQLAKSDDQGRLEDPELAWTAPSDGTYVLTIADLLKRGGADYVYRIEVNQAKPDFKASLETHALKLEPGKSVDVKVNVARIEGFSEKLVLVAEGLPEGVTATTVEVPAKSGEVTLTFAASAEAKPSNQPIHLLAIATNPDTPQIRPAMVNVKGQNAAVGDLQVNQTDNVWLTVLPKPAPPPAKKESKEGN